MKISDVFQPNGQGGVTSTKPVTIKGQGGGQASVNPGQQVGPGGALAGYNGKWILENLNADFPPGWSSP